MIWFTSDLHLGHSNILSLGEGRPFDSLDQMERYIIDAINDRVSYNDELWVLGDFYMRGTPDKVRPYLEKIVCPTVHLIRGNHDRQYQPVYEVDGKSVRDFTSVADYAEFAAESKSGPRLVLSHYPFMSWNRMRRGAYMLHGHIHSMPDAPSREVMAQIEGIQRHRHVGYNEWNRMNGYRRYDVGVDANDFVPVSLEQIEAFFKDMEISDFGG